MKKERVFFTCKICNKPFSKTKRVAEIARLSNPYAYQYCSECNKKKGLQK